MTYLKPIFAFAILAALCGCGLAPSDDYDHTGPAAAEPEMLRGMNLGDSADGTLHSQSMFMRSEAAALKRNAEDTSALAKKQKALADDYEKKALEAKADAVKLRKNRNANDTMRMRYECAVQQVARFEEEARAARRMAERLAYDAKTLQSKALEADRKAARLERRAEREDRLAKQKAKAEGK